MRKGKFRIPGLGAFLTTLAGIAGTIAAHPDILNSKPALISLGAAGVGSLIQAITQPAARKQEERY